MVVRSNVVGGHIGIIGVWFVDHGDWHRCLAAVFYTRGCIVTLFWGFYA